MIVFCRTIDNHDKIGSLDYNIFLVILFSIVLCFYSTYHWALLEIGYSMKDNNVKNIEIVKKIDSNDIGWTLGYMINQTNYLEPEYRPSRLLTKGEFIGILTCFLFILVASVVAILVALTIQRRAQ
jgi:hypothetical protein